MKWLLCIGIAVVCHSQIPAQDLSNGRFICLNSVQLDLGGQGLFYALNYERILFNQQRWKTAAQVGVSYYPESTGILDYWFPVGINEMYSMGSHHVEAGLAFVWVRSASRGSRNEVLHWFWDYFASGRLGYRYQKPDGRFLFRAGFTPFLELGTNFCDFHPSGGGTIGYAFGSLVSRLHPMICPLVGLPRISGELYRSSLIICMIVHVPSQE